MKDTTLDINLGHGQQAFTPPLQTVGMELILPLLGIAVFCILVQGTFPKRNRGDRDGRR